MGSPDQVAPDLRCRAIYGIYVETLLKILGGTLDADHPAILDFKKVPAGAQVVHASVDPNTGWIEITLYHHTFKPVPVGSKPPFVWELPRGGWVSTGWGHSWKHATLPPLSSKDFLTGSIRQEMQRQHEETRKLREEAREQWKHIAGSFSLSGRSDLTSTQLDALVAIGPPFTGDPQANKDLILHVKGLAGCTNTVQDNTKEVDPEKCQHQWEERGVMVPYSKCTLCGKVK